jgi:hypothetical protein
MAERGGIDFLEFVVFGEESFKLSRLTFLKGQNILPFPKNSRRKERD